jgi:hypothetical protein
MPRQASVLHGVRRRARTPSAFISQSRKGERGGLQRTPVWYSTARGRVRTMTFGGTTVHAIEGELRSCNLESTKILRSRTYHQSRIFGSSMSRASLYCGDPQSSFADRFWSASIRFHLSILDSGTSFAQVRKSGHPEATVFPTQTFLTRPPTCKT